MKYLVFILAFYVPFWGTNTWANVTYQELQHSYFMTDGYNKKTIDNYLLGVYEGINASNLGTYMNTRQFQYCKPQGFELNVHDLRKIIDQSHKKYNSNGNIPVPYLLYVGLKETFPCLSFSALDHSR